MTPFEYIKLYFHLMGEYDDIDDTIVKESEAIAVKNLEEKDEKTS